MPLPAVALLAALAMMTLVWVASLVKRDVSIIDVFWGLGFVLLGWIYFLPAVPHTPRGSLVVGLVTLWGLRLSLHILWRSRGRGEDYRYREMRERSPASFPLRSLLTVFSLQAVLLWAISMPLHQAQRWPHPASLTPVDLLGAGLFLLGFVFEAGGDWQLARFKRDPSSAGRVMDRGLWRYTRHPNYFGDAVVWWGFFCFAAATPGGGWTVFSPILMTLLLMRVSGVTLLEKRLQETKPAYRRYAERTNAFFPWFPANGRSEATIPGSATVATDLEPRILAVESALIALSIAAIAAADQIAAPDRSLGYLYLIPMSYSALNHRWPVFLPLLAACVGLRQWDTPVESQTWARLAVDWSLVAAFLAVVVPLRRLGRARAAFFRIAQEQRDELVREIQMAAGVQQHLLDQHQPPAGALDVVARMEPARVVGGDYYDFVPLDAGRFAVVVADVSGKGLPAALLMPAVKIALRALAARNVSSAELLAELNHVFLDNLPPASYFTLIYAVFDPLGGRLLYTNAGHPPAVHLKAGEGEGAWLMPGGPAIGLLHEGVHFETVEVPFGPGDLFVFYTDGITEAEDAAGAEFGRDGVLTAVRTSGHPSAEAVVSAVHEAVGAFRGEGPRFDDATVIVVRVPPTFRQTEIARA